MAPVAAIPRLLARHGLKYEDVALWEIHEAFAAQVLCNLAGLEDADYVREKAGVPHTFGRFPARARQPQRRQRRARPPVRRDRRAHPFARRSAELAAMPPGTRAIVSVCADGGLGTVALLERGTIPSAR